MSDSEVVQLRDALRMLLLLVEHETNLPDSAANGVTAGDYDQTDEGVVRASEIMHSARVALALHQQEEQDYKVKDV